MKATITFYKDGLKVGTLPMSPGSEADSFEDFMNSVNAHCLECKRRFEQDSVVEYTDLSLGIGHVTVYGSNEKLGKLLLSWIKERRKS